MDKMRRVSDVTAIHGDGTGIKWGPDGNPLWVLHGHWSTSKQTARLCLHKDPCGGNKASDALKLSETESQSHSILFGGQKIAHFSKRNIWDAS